MNINYELIDELKKVTKKHYEEEDYEQVIDEGLNLLNKALQERFELDLSGMELIDEILDLVDFEEDFNTIYSHLKKTTLKGILLYFKGLYNKEKDFWSYNQYQIINKEDADLVLLNINYLLGRIDVLKRRFDVEEFLYVIGGEDSLYPFDKALKLVESVPEKYKVEVALKGINKVNDNNYISYTMFFYKFFKTFTEEDLKDVNKLMSEIFRKYNTYDELFNYLAIFSGVYFKGLDEDVKIKLEHLMFEDLANADGRFLRGESNVGGFAAFALPDHLENYDKKKWSDEMVRKMRRSEEERLYIEKHVFYKIALLNDEHIEESLLDYVKEMLEKEDEFIVDYFNEVVYLFEFHPWNKVFKK